MTIREWLHHIINPHCQHCALQRDQELMIQERMNACRSCDSLRNQLDHERAEKNRLLEVILERSEPAKEETNTHQVFQNPVPISSGIRGWAQQRAELERADAEMAEKIRQERAERMKAQTQKLEQETGVINNG